MKAVKVACLATTVVMAIAFSGTASAGGLRPETQSWCILLGAPKTLQPDFDDFGTPCFTYTGVRFPWDLSVDDEIDSITLNGKKVSTKRFEYEGMLYEPERKILTPGRYSVRIRTDTAAQWRCSVQWKDVCRWFKQYRDYTVWKFRWDGTNVTPL